MICFELILLISEVICYIYYNIPLANYQIISKYFVQKDQNLLQSWLQPFKISQNS